MTLEEQIKTALGPLLSERDSLKARVAELEADLKLADDQYRTAADAIGECCAKNASRVEGLEQALEQACNILDEHPNPSARIASMSMRGFLKVKP